MPPPAPNSAPHSAPAPALAATPQPPYWAVIFTSLRDERPGDGYGQTADRMVELGSRQPGFLGLESARGSDRLGVTVSYWSSLEAIAAWKAVAEHEAAQRAGRARWYHAFATRVARVEREAVFQR